ncbi:AAA family ATPase [Gottfriedia acidiceleris]|uniref:EVE domain-containing protein n=1 Tax=Gottfriedia acidiceleris TaxID=371036 RepID=A0ABY4JMW5_9BACI|nr:AAA family ATPase [Gottfriedia acidiceleris]UPM53660.1 EVE domain-containing protein [Gottfriedia acidiceleris]
MSIPNNITREHIIKALEEIDQMGIENLRPPSKFELYFDGKRYPPKEVIRFANEIANGDDLYNFSGGDESNNFLLKNGFSIVLKGTDQTIGMDFSQTKGKNLEQLIGKGNVFNSFDEANWAFNFIQDMVTQLGIQGPGDERLAITYPKDRKTIHINFCSWLLSGFYNNKQNQTFMLIPFTEAKELESVQSSDPFSKSLERNVRLYYMPLVDVQSLPKTLEENYKDTLQYILNLFETQKRSPYRIHNQVQIESAIFNYEMRDNLLMNGLEIGVKDESVQHFWLTANPSIWDVSKIKNGEAVFYTAYNQEGNKRRIFNAFQSAQPKDKIIFYESTPRKEVVALGEVLKGFHEEQHEGFSEPVNGVSFRYIRDVNPISWAQILAVEGLVNSSPVKNAAQGSLFKLTKEEYETILALEETEISTDVLKLSKIDFTTPITIGNLHFEDEQIIIKQAQTAIKNGKNVILTGPPGTGKSKLAKEICRSYRVNYQMTTATSDWSTYETIGGYRPLADGTLSFKPGLFLSCFKNPNTYQQQNEWLIIDEMNRADIDKAFGALFSALTGDPITLPFTAESGNQVMVRPQTLGNISKNDYDYMIPNDWRLIGTMNTFDKASLYEMSYAFMRRFAFIPVGVPKNITEELIVSYLTHWKLEGYNYIRPLAQLWKIINEYRQMGPAIVEDLAKFSYEEGDFTSAVILYALPQFEGLMEHQIVEFVNRVGEMEEIEKDRLINFVYDFYQIKE